MGAEEGVDVLRLELALLGSVLGPIGVVADHLVPVGVWGAELGGRYPSGSLG